MSFVTKQETADFNGPWQVGVFITIDVPKNPSTGLSGPQHTINTWSMESRHQDRHSAAAWCSYLNGGQHPELVVAAVLNLKTQTANEVSRIIGSIRA